MNDTPTPTEKAQIAVGFHNSQTILRYNTEKRAVQQLNKLEAAWKKFKVDGKNPIFNMQSDMFDAYFDLTQLVYVSIVVYTKRDKFIPR